MRQEVGDRAAIAFAVGFYDAIGAGRSIAEAFQFGRNAIALEGIPEANTPILVSEANLTITSDSTITNNFAPEVSRRLSDSSELTLRSFRELEALGWTPDATIRRLIEIDYATLAGLDEVSEGSLAQWTDVLKNNPEGYSFVLNPSRELVGYWHFEAIQEDLFERAMSGCMEEEEITLDKLRLLCLPGLYDIYFIIVSVLPRYRGYRINRILLDSWLDRLSQFAESGIFIRSLCANAFTPEGVALCRSIGMQRRLKHVRNGEIYYMSMATPNLLLKSRPELAQLTMEANKS
jgi:hypothetical protein